MFVRVGPAQASTRDFDVAAFDAHVMALQAETGVPGLAVAIVEDGETVLARGYGIAGPDDQPVTAQTVFQIGSITKSFVALVMLQLAAESKVDLDAPVVRYVPNFRTANKRVSDAITVNQLITHRSGLTTLHGNSFASVDDDVLGPEAIITSLQYAQLHAEPGASFQYSNANYGVLAHLIEVLDDRSFEEALDARIFEPLAMKHSFVGNAAVQNHQSATGYTLWFGFPVAQQAPEQSMPAHAPNRRMIGAGGIWASIDDLARYVEAVRSNDPRVVPVGGTNPLEILPFAEPWGYGYGWFSETTHSKTVFAHSGLTPGFYTLATIVPGDVSDKGSSEGSGKGATEGKVVVVLTNASGLAQGELPTAVTNLALGLAPVPAVAPLGAQLASWSALCAPLGFLLLLYKVLRGEFRRGVSVSTRQSPHNLILKILAAIGLGALVTVVYFSYPTLLSISFATSYAYYPDLTASVIAAMMIASLIAGVLLISAWRDFSQSQS